MACWIVWSQDIEASSHRAGWLCRFWNVVRERILPRPSTAEAYRDRQYEEYCVQLLSSERCISYSRRSLVRIQPLDLLDIVVLPNALSHLAESWVVSIRYIARRLPIATMTNSLLQITISVLRAPGNGAALLNACECFQSSQPSLHRWQDNIAASDCLYNA